MAVAIVMDFEGATLDNYNRVLELMELEAGGAGPDGILFHWAAQTDTGIRVVDVWESREEFEKFAEDQIGPHTQAAGFPAPPEMTFHDVHSHMTAG